MKEKENYKQPNPLIETFSLVKSLETQIKRTLHSHTTIIQIMKRRKQKKRTKKEMRDHLFIEVKGEESAIAKANKSANEKGMST